jgi:hypothetical protein
MQDFAVIVIHCKSGDAAIFKISRLISDKIKARQRWRYSQSPACVSIGLH